MQCAPQLTMEMSTHSIVDIRWGAWIGYSLPACFQFRDACPPHVCVAIFAEEKFISTQHFNYGNPIFAPAAGLLGQSFPFQASLIRL